MPTLFESFAARAQAVSAEVHHFSTRAEGLEFVLDLVRSLEGDRLQPSFAIWAACPFLAGLDEAALTERAPGLAFQVTRASAAAASVGISQMDLAIADTGTLVQNATAVEQRLVSTLPSVHIAILATDAIVPDLTAALGRLYAADGPDRLEPQKSEGPPPYLSFITGPSRTGDIERILVLGAHGPKKLTILCV